MVSSEALSGRQLKIKKQKKKQSQKTDYTNVQNTVPFDKTENAVCTYDLF